MIGNLFVISLETDATLAADYVRRFQLPYAATLEKINAGADNSTSFILDVGTAADADAYLDAATVTGAALTTTVYDKDDFVGGEPIHIAAGTEVVVTIDYDGGAGTDGAGVHVDLWFREG